MPFPAFEVSISWIMAPDAPPIVPPLAVNFPWLAVADSRNLANPPNEPLPTPPRRFTLALPAVEVS